MRICLFTMHSPVIKRMAAMTVPNKSEYCCLHGYDFVQAAFTSEIHWWPGYERIPFMINLLKSEMWDWIFWLGCDAMITGPQIKLEGICDDNYGMIISSAANELQMDSLLFNKKCIGLFEEIWRTREDYLAPGFEQWSLIAQIAKPEFTGLIKHVPQRILNSMDYNLYPDYAAGSSNFAKQIDVFGNDGQWQPGDFVYHVPGRPLEVKEKSLREHIPTPWL